jgi:hypothetical protein
MIFHDCKRYGKVTSNPVENVNGAVLSIQAKPIMDIIVELSCYIHRKMQEHCNDAMALLPMNETITPWGKSILQTVNEQALQCQVVLSVGQHRPDGIIRAVVSNSSKVEFTVAVKGATFEYSCNCKWSDEYGMPCCHCQAVIRSKPELRSDDVRWLERPFHLNVYSAMYSQDTPLLAKHNLEVKEMVPSEIRKKSGRPKTKRYDSQNNRATVEYQVPTEDEQMNNDVYLEDEDLHFGTQVHMQVPVENSNDFGNVGVGVTIDDGSDSVGTDDGDDSDSIDDNDNASWNVAGDTDDDEHNHDEVAMGTVVAEVTGAAAVQLPRRVVIKVCNACGTSGHNEKGCTSPNLEYIYCRSRECVWLSIKSKEKKA